MTVTALAPTMPSVRDAADKLRCSVEAVQIARTCEIVDLHIDTFIPTRLWGYDPLTRHAKGLLGGAFFGHLDVHRMYEGGLTGAMWSITTNPFRGAEARWRVFLKNLERLRAMVASTLGHVRIARTLEEYKAARTLGAHVCLPAIQGGNALEAAPEGPASIPDDVVTRVTLVHLTSSCYGATSSPFAMLGGEKGLTKAGRELVERLNERRIFVDLAHISPKAFWDAVEVHDHTQPLIATHTGVSGVKRSWRNLDDDQLKAIADTGGTVGIIFHKGFLKHRGGPRDGAMVVEHMEHAIKVVGEDFVSVGSDYDGMILPPRDLRSGDSYPRLVQHMLDRGWSELRIGKVLGLNALRAFGLLRPE
jgi:membrane dipeptidase